MALKKRKSIRKPKENMEIDITSLLDVLVILLVFLLKSYNASDLELSLVEKVRLPSSLSKKLGQHEITIQINKDKDIFIDHKKVASIRGSSQEIPDLLEILKERRAEQESKKIDSKNINLVMDKSLPYETMKKVMHTASIAGYPQFKFIVKGSE